MSEPAFNGREQVLAWQQEQQAERNTVTQVDHYAALGVGLAGFCVAMYQTLMADQTFTEAQSVELVKAAVTGR
jgi:hypothetical protein